MDTTTDVVRKLYEAYQARDWDTAAALVHEDAVLEMPATRERLTGRPGIIGFQRTYPEPWGDLSVLRVVGDGNTAAAEIEVVAPDATFRMAAFWRSEGGLLRDGAEYWITVGGEDAPDRQRVRG